MGVLDNNLLVADISLWDPCIDAGILKAGGVDTVIVKLGSGGVVDPMFYTNAKKVVDGGLHLHVYYWDDIIIDPSKQAQWAVAEIKKCGFPVEFMWTDMEQWWSNWLLHTQAVQGAIPYSEVPRPSAASLSGHFQTFMSVANGLIPAKVGTYTNWGFISSWALPMTSWIGKYPLWEPEYHNIPPSDLREKGYTCSWEELKAKWLPEVWPYPPTGTTTAMQVGYQWTGDAFKLPGVTNEVGRRMLLDLSLFKKTFMLANRTPIGSTSPIPGPAPVPAPVPGPAPVVPPVVSGVGKYVVTVNLLNIRKGPSSDTALVTQLVKNTVATVVSAKDGWALLNTGAYAFFSYLAPYIPVPVSKILGAYIVNAELLNIRLGAGTMFNFAGSPLPKNTAVNVVEVSGEWARLTTGVWCFLQYLMRAPWPTSQAS